MVLFGVEDKDLLYLGGVTALGGVLGYGFLGRKNSVINGLLGAAGAGLGYYLFGIKKYNPFAGAFATSTTSCPTGTVSIGQGQCYDFNSNQIFTPAPPIYQYQQQYYPYQQYQQQYYDPYQYQYQQPSYSSYYPQYYQQQQQYYYPYQQQYTSPTYQQYQQYTQPQQNLTSCISACMQMYQY